MHIAVMKLIDIECITPHGYYFFWKGEWMKDIKNETLHSKLLQDTKHDLKNTSGQINQTVSKDSLVQN